VYKRQNLTHESFQHDLSDVLADAAEVGISTLVVTGASYEGSHAARSLAERYPEKLYATAGIHPHHAEETSVGVMNEFKELAASTKVKAIGETGLDFFRDFSPRPLQEKSFEQHIELAVELGMPMFLHERDAYPRFAEMLRPYRDNLPRVVVHCFTGEKEALFSYLDMDCHIGITGWICDERRGTHLLELIHNIPENRLLIETDAPYLTPRNIRPKPKSRRNIPSNLTYVCQAVAEARNETYEQVAANSTANAIAFFDLDDNLQASDRASDGSVSNPA